MIAAGRVPAFLRDLLDLLLPAACLGCRRPLSRPAGLVCARCRAGLRGAPWPRCVRCDAPVGTGRAPGPDCLECRGWPTELARARSAVVLEPPAPALVHALKYGGWSELGRPLGARMVDALRVGGGVPDGALVVPVPTTRSRLRVRGYNQAAVLARTVADSLGLRFSECLVRAGAGRTQVSLHPAQRRANVRNAFSVPVERRPEVGGMPVLLVDDVLTTGATAGAAALALGRSGALSVTLLTFARALPYRDRRDGAA